MLIMTILLYYHGILLFFILCSGYSQLDKPWGLSHPDKRVVLDTDMRVKWTEAEVNYVQKWMRGNPGSPVRKLFDDIHRCPLARKLFHGHHVAIDKITYMYKKSKDFV